MSTLTFLDITVPKEFELILTLFEVNLDTAWIKSRI